jgi:cell division protein FtsB
MTQRRTPSGQGPSRRPGQAGRPTARSRVRDTGSTRIEPRPSAGRIPPSRKARPTSARRTAATGATKRTVAKAPRAFTGRATVLIVVLIALALGYTYPVRVYLAQESKIAKMKQDQETQRGVIAGKAQTVAKWQDPEYIRIQARDRFFYVRPGEIPLLVLNDPAGAARDAGKKSPAAAPDRWYETLWGSVGAANAEPRQ